MKPVNAKLRSINTKFWEDRYIIELKPLEKLIYLYLFSNNSVALAGCYEITTKKISNDTGIKIKEIDKLLEKFKNDKKITYLDGFIIIKNYLKNQSWNKNMQINAIRTIEQLPDNIRKAFIGFVKPLKGFESLWKVEDELETEVETEGEAQKEGEYKGEGKKFDLPPSEIIRNNSDESGMNSNEWNGFSKRTLSRISNA
jgi:hypothetical protein